MLPSVRAWAPGGSSGRNWRRAPSRAASGAAVTPACTVTVRSSGLYSSTWSRPPRSRTKATRAGGAPGSWSRPDPHGTTARPASQASPRTWLTWRSVSGLTTQRGLAPSRAKLAGAVSPSCTRGAPTIAASALPTVPVTALTLDPGALGQAWARGPPPLAAGRVRRQELFRVHEPLGVENTPQAIHEVQIGISILKRQVLRLIETHTMLARDGAPHRDAGVKQLLVGRLRALEFIRVSVVIEDERVQVAVARVEDVGDLHAVARADRAELPHDRGQLGTRHDGVLQEVGRREAPDGPRRFLPALPEQRALRGVLRH